MPKSTTTRVIPLSLREALFAQVIEILEIGLSRSVDEKEAEAFLVKHPAILGSLVQYDEVDTEDRYRIWERCNDWQPPRSDRATA